ncbi:MAG: hypothetical protein HQL75_11965 [Magnetococcales bacterium]|nr:hypothetical protein [Magnetococcales bacterium]
MNETRLYYASQGYLESIDETERIWAVIALFLIAAIFLTVHLLIKRSRTAKTEKDRARRKKK